jgi:hypothetical protein
MKAKARTFDTLAGESLSESLNPLGIIIAATGSFRWWPDLTEWATMKRGRESILFFLKLI